MKNTINIDQLAYALGYEFITWDADNDCYSGYGSSDPMDRSRDGAEGFCVAGNDDELEHIAQRVCDAISSMTLPA